MRGCTRIVIVIVVAGMLATLNACGSSPPAPSVQLDLTGTWSGVYGPPGSGTARRLTWVATQTSNVVSGIATLFKPQISVAARGALTGTLVGDRITLSYFVPTDSIPGFARCSITGLGEATATNTSMSGQLRLRFDSCDGTGLEPPGNNDLMLAR